MLDINVTAPLYLSQKAIAMMNAEKGGTIVNISSYSGCFNVSKFPQFGAYNISKYALWGLTEILALENKNRNIRINQLSPSGVDTQMLQQAMGSRVGAEFAPEDVAEKVLFLASDDSAPMTGQNLMMPEAQSEMISLEKAEKLTSEYKYFNISVIWIFYYRHVLRIFYYLKIPHEIVTLLSILSGLLSAYFFYSGTLIAAVIAIHLKDVFDACDGALARLTGRGHIIGRYLDSIGDFFVLTIIMIAIACRASHQISSIYIAWGAVAIISTFIQCSFFNYYQLAYLERYGIDRLISKQNEKARDDIEIDDYGLSGRLLLKLMRFLYIVIYSWQDRLVAAVDEKLYSSAKSGSKEKWYGDRFLMVLQSALCFGTHIFVIIVFSLLGKPYLALIFIGTVMNIYLFYLLYHRKKIHLNDRSAMPGDTNDLEEA
jgi:phosphatidylserine synthase